ncbi:RusA family crossover junction endodeoxyribonuclease [Bordetella genomosp. 4]|uniref:Crossover junction endodeoxyribonuclease RusA n=1 Tax=Bordetella genomosp. 4 TaxID=463044 RepID=A0A261U473_9BORD|nr:RusA family crossover junction endodeoxyribonuclease [Bordetella genomosp. 4]OZI56754.1 hypothetical protein CAL20_15250 [Bordetella genomosp. 4]
MTVIELPFPPSVNSYWRSPNSGKLAGRTLISEKGRVYRADVLEVAARYRVPMIRGRVAVTIDAFMPDRRRRDLDNMLKALLDGLVHARVIEDDSLIDKLSIERCGMAPKGFVRVFINPIRNQEAS